MRRRGDGVYLFARARPRCRQVAGGRDQNFYRRQAVAARGRKGILPIDHIIAKEAEATAETRITKTAAIPEEWQGFDIGPKTGAAITQVCREAKTIFWNGPLGMFECEPFAAGTMAVARAVAASGAVTVVGGGDSIAALHRAEVADRITHVSTGGGASLEFIEGLALPGVTALE